MEAREGDKRQKTEENICAAAADDTQTLRKVFQ